MKTTTSSDEISPPMIPTFNCLLSRFHIGWKRILAETEKAGGDSPPALLLPQQPDHNAQLKHDDSAPPDPLGLGVQGLEPLHKTLYDPKAFDQPSPRVLKSAQDLHMPRKAPCGEHRREQ